MSNCDRVTQCVTLIPGFRYLAYPQAGTLAPNILIGGHK